MTLSISTNMTVDVKGLFGMNVNILADNPSVKWYFIIALPATALVLIVALLFRRRKWIRGILFRRNHRKE